MSDGGALPEAVVVFGAGGFIGRNIVEALRGRIGLLIGVTARGRPVPGCEISIAADGVDDLPPLPKRTAIVHVAAARYDARSFMDRQPEILAANIAAVDQLYRFALTRGATEIRAASSSAVYPASWPLMDDSRPLDLNEWPHAGEAAYAWSKRWGEIAAELWRRRAGINTISFRLTNPYGPFDTLDAAAAHVATAFVLRALDPAPEFLIRGDPEAERDFVFAGDVARCFVASLALTGVQAAVNCASGAPTRVIELARAVLRAADDDRPIRTDPPPPGAGGVKRRIANATGLRALLPELPPFLGLDEGLRRTLNWYRDALG